MPPPAAELAGHLGLAFTDLTLLEQALAHSSYFHEHPELIGESNERLEFLGDAVISLVISEALWGQHPTENEGSLTTRRAAIVSTRGLATIARRLDLGRYLLFGEGADRAHEGERDSVLAGAMEAITGAIYLHLGFDTVRTWLLTIARSEVEDDTPPATLKAPKSRLQEHSFSVNGRPPTYRVVSAEGPDHAKQFVVEVHLDGVLMGIGEGRSRREAETAAAERALVRIAAS